MPAALGEVVRFKRQPRDGWGPEQVARLLERERKEAPPIRPRRSSRAPWLPTMALVGAATAGYFMSEQRSHGVGASGDLRLSIVRGGDFRPASVDGSGGFRLCSGANQQNCVVDGDTIRYGGVTIRLADVDTPETRDPKCASEAALGQQATQRLLELINAGPFQIVHSGGRDEDIYGRKLRIIERDGRSVGDALVANGLARRWEGARRSWCG
jgi:micrococcal nuclease